LSDLKKFSIDDISLFRKDEDVDFAIAEIDFLADGNNGQNSPISTEVLKRDAHTVLGKPVVAKYHSYMGDVGTHESDEIIIGWVPGDSQVKFVEREGRTFARCEAVISKLYATDVYLLFTKENRRSVSSEFSAYQPDMNEAGEGEIESFHVHGITVLGKKVPPAVQNAGMEIKRFSESDASRFYHEYNLNPLKAFADKRREKMEGGKSYKLNKTTLKNTPWGDVDKTELRNKIMEAKNKNSLVHSVYLLVEDGWEDAPSEHLKYPVMELSGDTFYYNKGGIKSAKGYAESENESEVLAKVGKLEKKFKLGEHSEDNKKEGKEEEKEMTDKKFSQLEGREIYGEVIKRVQSKLGKDMYVEEIYGNHVEIKKVSTGELFTIPANIKVGKDDEKMEIEIDYDKMKKSDTQKQFSEEKKEEKEGKKDEDKPKEDKKFEDHHDEEDKDDVEEEDDEDLDKNLKDAEKKDEKKMSLDANADAGALLTMLESETEAYKELSEDNKELLRKLWAEEDKTVIMKETAKLMSERNTLKASNEEMKEKQKKFEKDECEAEFAKCMSRVKGDIDEADYKKFYDEGKSIEESDKMKAFSERVRLFAYDNSEKNESSFFRFGSGTNNIQSNQSNTEEDVFARISSK
jgi:hypothetical protein